MLRSSFPELYGVSFLPELSEQTVPRLPLISYSPGTGISPEPLKARRSIDAEKGGRGDGVAIDEQTIRRGARSKMACAALAFEQEGMRPPC
jgi:hypothetical protein